jgi:hypothetical protein
MMDDNLPKIEESKTNNTIREDNPFIYDYINRVIRKKPEIVSYGFRFGNDTNYVVIYPTGHILLPAGTATLAPLKFTTGTALATPEAGAMEYHTDRFWITNKATRRAVDRTSDVALASVTVSNTTTETTVFTGAVPANSLVAGNILKFVASGEVDETTAADLCTIRLKIGGSTLATIVSPGAGTANQSFHMTGFATLRSVGATGGIAWHIDMDVGGSADDASGVGTVDTTSAENVTVTVQWNNAKAGNIFVLEQGFMEYKN